jgi:hypothetical protein
LVSELLFLVYHSFTRRVPLIMGYVYILMNKSVLQLKPVIIICSHSAFISLTSLLFTSKSIMMWSIQDFIRAGVEVGQLFDNVWILSISGKWRTAQNKKIGHSKKLRIREIPVGFRYKFENGNPDKRGIFWGRLYKLTNCVGKMNKFCSRGSKTRLARNGPMWCLKLANSGVFPSKFGLY